MSIYAEENCCLNCTIWNCDEPCSVCEQEMIENDKKERELEENK